jgi:hypothetical protein
VKMISADIEVPPIKKAPLNEGASWIVREHPIPTETASSALCSKSYESSQSAPFTQTA